MEYGVLKYDGMARLADNAEDRISAGYSFPPIPETDGKWNKEYRNFVNECTSVLKTRLDDHMANSGYRSVHPKYQDALLYFRDAASSRDMDLVKANHRLILSCDSPPIISKCVKTLRNVTGRTSVADILTVQHLESRKMIDQAIWESEKLGAESLEQLGFLLDDIVEIAFEDLSKTNLIVTCIIRGILELDGIRSVLKSSKDVNTPLLDGFL